MYRSIDTKFWTDPKIRRLTPPHKFLFLYLITSGHSHVSGIYYLPKVLMQHETGLSVKDVSEGIDTLSRDYLIAYDSTTEVVWVRHMLRYQHHGEKIRLAVSSQLESLHNCLLINEFLEEYSDLDIPYAYPIDTRAGARYQDQEQEQNKEQEKKTTAKVVKMGVTEISAHTKYDWPTPEAFVMLYNTHTPPDHPKVTLLTPDRRKRILLYLELFPERSFWEKVYAELSISPFLRGQKSSKDRRPVKRGLDWLLSKGEDKLENCVKTYEGKYRETQIDLVRNHTNDQEYRGLMAGQRFMERHNGQEGQSSVPAGDATIVDCTEYRIN